MNESRKIILSSYSVVAKACSIESGIASTGGAPLARSHEVVIGAFIDACEVCISEDEVDRRVEQMVSNFGTRLRTSGVELENFLVETGRTENELRIQLRDMAREALKKEAVLWEVARAERIAVSPSEVGERLIEIARLSGESPEAVQAGFEADGRMSLVVQELLFAKVSDFIVGQCGTR